MLNRDNAEFGVEDGMDISIVEFNKKTGKIRAASAKRPIVIYKNNERIILKGDRYSIGGSYEGDNKKYSLHEMTLSKGDSIYQFSDGFSDQFGGQHGKKLKKNGLMEILDNLVHLDMDHQGRIIRQKFFDWKGDFPQVDDVIMVGIRM
jgi:serine phosphatase RsbU (regulator of sigma subunit)